MRGLYNTLAPIFVPATRVHVHVHHRVCAPAHCRRQREAGAVEGGPTAFESPLTCTDAGRLLIALTIDASRL
ncbi:unnamed protein product, partial [Brenthis ino]